MTGFLRLTLLVLALAATGCSGCGDKKAADPAVFLSKDAQVVAELSDLAYFVKNPKLLGELLEGIASPDQQIALFGQAQRTLGADLFTEKGLEAAGLPKNGGAVMIELVNQGRQALAIVPVADRKLFAPMVKRYADSRAEVKKEEIKKIAGHDVTVLSTMFGPQEAVILAWTEKNGAAIIGVGAKGTELVQGALERTKEQSLLSNPEFAGLRKDIGPGLLRIFMPGAKELAALVAQGMSASGAPDVGGLGKEVTSMGWVLDVKARQVTLNGRARFTDAGRKQLSEIWRPVGKTPAGVRALQHDDAVLVGLASADIQAMIKAASTPGSKFEADMKTLFEKLKTETGVDFEKELIAKLSGHAGFSAGFGDLQAFASIREIIQNPAGLIWTDFSLGLKDDKGIKALDAIGPKIDPMLDQRGFARVVRKAGKVDTTAIVGKDREDFLLVEMFFAGSALNLVNHKGRAVSYLADIEKPRPDALGGKAGLMVEARFGPLMLAARQVNVDRLVGSGAEAMLVKAFIGKAMLVLAQLDKLEVQMTHEDNGIAISATLKLLSGARSKS